MKPLGRVSGVYPTRAGGTGVTVKWDDGKTRALCGMLPPPTGLEIGARVRLILSPEGDRLDRVT